jgi:hypothetical protein
MHWIFRWARLPREERILLVESAACLAAARFRLMRNPSAPIGRTTPHLRTLRSARYSVEAVSAAIDRAAARLPFDTSCLVRALAARALLARSGLATELVIGVAANPSSKPLFHAWLMAEDTMVTGQRADLARFRPLLAGR